MAITYQDITDANKELNTMDIKGKDYVVVPQRVKAFRMVYPDGFILTDIVSHENGVIVMQAKAGYYDVNGEPKVLGSGMAFEKADSSYINKTSYIENCETSAVGRALGFMGFGIDTAICSAEELVNAMNNQGKPVPQSSKPANAEVAKQETLPLEQRVNKVLGKEEQKPPKPETPGAFIKRSIAEIKVNNPSFDFMKSRAELIKGGVIEDVPSATMNMEQAKALITAITANLSEAS